LRRRRRKKEEEEEKEEKEREREREREREKSGKTYFFIGVVKIDEKKEKGDTVSMML